MSGSDRGGQSAIVEWAFPLVGICLAILIAWGIGYLQARETYNHKQAAAAYEKAAKEDVERSCIGIDPTSVFKCVNDKTKAAYETQHSEDDLAAQQRAASSALFSAFTGFCTLLAAIFAAFYARSAAVHTERSADIASKSLDGSERPHLLYTNCELKLRHPLLNNTYPFTFQFINYGRGPCWIRKWGYLISIRNGPNPLDDDPVNIKVTPQSPWAIAPNTSWNSSKPIEVPIESDMVESVLAGDRALCVFWAVTYTDAEGREHNHHLALTLVEMDNPRFVPFDHPLSCYT